MWLWAAPGSLAAPAGTRPARSDNRPTELAADRPFCARTLLYNIYNTFTGILTPLLRDSSRKTPSADGEEALAAPRTSTTALRAQYLDGYGWTTRARVLRGGGSTKFGDKILLLSRRQQMIIYHSTDLIRARENRKREKNSERR